MTWESQRIADLETALNSLWSMIESGELVRDISKDAQPDWPMRLLHFTRKLAEIERIRTAR